MQDVFLGYFIYFIFYVEFNTLSATIRVTGHALDWIELLGGSRERGRQRERIRKKENRALFTGK